MYKSIGRLLTAGGLIGVLYFGYMYIQDSNSFEAFGADIAVSTGDYVPVLVSAIALLAGIVLSRKK